VKSYFLDELNDEASVWAALSRALPNWVDPWLLKDERDDIIAYFNVNRMSARQLSVQADLSGRHYNEDGAVIRLLKSLQDQLGGVVTDDDDNIIA
jgi:hypothetical protein